MPKLICTEDGSHSLYVKELDEHYHSVHGAVTESEHVFIEAGLKAVPGDHIDIFEMGFGTGLNAFLTLIEIRGSGKTVHYTGLEKYPLEPDTLESLNYASFSPKNLGKFFNALHRAPWNKKTEINFEFILEKIDGDIRNLDFLNQFDLVYFDAFSPDKQPELWTTGIFIRIFRSMKSGSILTTYSSKGQIRRNMAEAGFRVEKLPGPLKKHDMTRAWKD